MGLQRANNGHKTRTTTNGRKEQTRKTTKTGNNKKTRNETASNEKHKGRKGLQGG